MEQGKLDKNLISQPELWRLGMTLSDRALDVALYPPVENEEMIWRSFRLDPAAINPLKALEDVIYDNPLLLDDFKKVECLTDYCYRMPLPAESTNDDCRTALATTNPEIDTESEIEIHSTGCSNAIVASVQDADIKSFLLRTFYNIRFTDRMSMLCRYFRKAGGGNGTSRIYALTRDRRMKLIAIDGDRLLLANDFDYQKPIDAAYYIMASMESLGLDMNSTGMHIEGSDRQEIAEILNPYIRSIDQIPLSTLHCRASKATLQAPFDLLILPTCE